MSKAINSFLVATTLAARRAVALTAGETVGYPANNQAMPIGITLDTVLDTTSSIPVACAGEIAELLFNDTVSAAGLVSIDASGRGIPFTLANTTTALTLASAYIGVLVGPAVGVTATIARVLINPGYDRE